MESQQQWTTWVITSPSLSGAGMVSIGYLCSFPHVNSLRILIVCSSPWCVTGFCLCIGTLWSQFSLLLHNLDSSFMLGHVTSGCPSLWLGYSSARFLIQLPQPWAEYWVIKQTAFLIKSCEQSKHFNKHLCNGSLFFSSWIDSVSLFPISSKVPIIPVI